MATNSLTQNLRKIERKSNLKRNNINLTNKNSFYLFPFKPVLGIVNQSNLGINDEINLYDQSTYERIFTGLANLTARWRDSWEVKKENDTDTFLTKTYKVGVSYKGFFTTHVKGVSFEPSPIDDNFLSQVTDDTIICYSYDDIPEENIQDFYIVPQIKKNKWFFIKNITENKSKQGTTLYTIILQSVNNILATTGRAIEEFIQYGAPGEGYPFPEIDDEGNIKVDDTRAKDVYVQSMQIENSGALALGSIFAWGRPVEADMSGGSIQPKFNPKIEAPRRLIPYRIETPLPSPINTKPNAETNWYWGVWKPKYYDFYESWKKQWENNYSLVDRTQYEGVLTADSRQDVEMTNPVNAFDNAHQYTMWDSTWKINVKNQKFNTYADNMSSDSITLNGDYTAPELLTQMGFITSFIETLPLSVEQLVSWNLRDIPIIGGFLSKLTFGIPIGWNQLNIRIPAQTIPLFIPTQVVKYGNVMREQSKESQDLFLPLEIFAGTLENDATTFSGINTMSSIWKIGLTDRFSKVFNGRAYSFNTKDLGQEMPNKDDEGNDIDFGGNKPQYLINEGDIKPLPRKVPGYVIDFSNWKGLTKMPNRLTFFTAGGLQVWHGTYKSNAMLTNALRDWTNFMKMSDWNTQDGKYIDYPKEIVEPKPPEPNTPNIDLTQYLPQTSIYNSNLESDNDYLFRVWKDWIKSTERSSAGGTATYNDLTSRWLKIGDRFGEYDLNQIGGVLGLQANYEFININFSVKRVEHNNKPIPENKNFTIQVRITDLISSGYFEYDLKKENYFEFGSPATFDCFYINDSNTHLPIIQNKPNAPYLMSITQDKAPIYYAEYRDTMFKMTLENQTLKFGWSEKIIGYIPTIENNKIINDDRPASDFGYTTIYYSRNVPPATPPPFLPDIAITKFNLDLKTDVHINVEQGIINEIRLQRKEIS